MRLRTPTLICLFTNKSVRQTFFAITSKTVRKLPSDLAGRYSDKTTHFAYRVFATYLVKFERGEVDNFCAALLRIYR